MINRKIIKILAWLALIAFIFTSLLILFPFSAAADTKKDQAQQKIDDERKQQDDLKIKIEETEQEKNEFIERKAAIDKDIIVVEGEVSVLDGKIAQSDKKIMQKQDELDIAEAKSQEQYEAYKSRVKLMVEKGPITYLEVLLNASSFSDFLSRISIVKQIANYDSGILDEYKETEVRIASLKKDLEDEKAIIVNMRDEVNLKKVALESKKAESQKMIDDLQADEDEFNAALLASKKAEEAARLEVAEIIRKEQEAARQKSGGTGTQSQYTGGALLWPSASSYTVTSPYSMRTHPTLGVYKQHTGIDIGAAYGTAVLAAADGKVIIAGWNNAYGNYIVISHGGGLSTLYGHNSMLLVRSGETVTRGQTIAKVGSTGYSTGPHIHFEVQVNGIHVDPLSYLK